MRAPALTSRLLASVVVSSVVACTGGALLPVEAGIGANPALPEPRPAFIPTVHVVEAKGWAAGEMPSPANGLTVTAFARGLDHPRWLYVLPNGDVLVAETNAPKRPDDNKGLKGWFFKRFQKKAGGAVPSADRITLLRDADGDGIAETRSVLLSGLTSPFGMALVGDALYVANTDALMRFHYVRGDTRIAEPATVVAPLPGGHRVFAFGMRNPVGMAWEPTLGALWVSVNERDELGSDLVPDYMTAVRDGGFYG